MNPMLQKRLLCVGSAPAVCAAPEAQSTGARDRGCPGQGASVAIYRRRAGELAPRRRDDGFARRLKHEIPNLSSPNLAAIAAPREPIAHDAAASFRPPVSVHGAVALRVERCSAPEKRHAAYMRLAANTVAVAGAFRQGNTRSFFSHGPIAQQRCAGGRIVIENNQRPSPRMNNNR